MTPARSLPPLPDRTLLADLCRETAARERLQPQVIEKDFYLTRLLWALGDALGDQALLKGSGGTEGPIEREAQQRAGAEQGS